MKTTIMLIILAGLVNLNAWEFTRKDGVKFTEDQVSEVAADGLVFTTGSGIEKVKVKDLPPEVVGLYGFTVEAVSQADEITGLKRELMALKAENEALKEQLAEAATAKKPRSTVINSAQLAPAKTQESFEITERDKNYAYQKAVVRLRQRYGDSLYSLSKKDECEYKPGNSKSIIVTFDLVLWETNLGKRERVNKKDKVTVD